MPMFSGMRNSSLALLTLCDVSGSQKSNLAAGKPEIPHISGDREDRIEIATTSNLIPKYEQSVRTH